MYGSLVAQLVKDHEDYGEVNNQLEKMFVLFPIISRLLPITIFDSLLFFNFDAFLFTSFRGYQIGMRIIEDFLSRSGSGKCSDFREVGEMVSKVSLSIFQHIVIQISSTIDITLLNITPGRIQDVS